MKNALYLSRGRTNARPQLILRANLNMDRDR